VEPTSENARFCAIERGDDPAQLNVERGSSDQ